MMTVYPRSFVRVILGSVAACAVGFATPLALGQTEDAAKPAARATPEDVEKLGRVYYLQPTDGPQVTFTSSAPAEKFKGTTNKLSGYVVAPTHEGASPVEFVAGEFRLPVATLDTGNPTRNEHMRQAQWLNAGSFPEIVFKLSGVKDAKLVKQRDNSQLYTADLKGTMTILDKSVDMSIRARISLGTSGGDPGGGPMSIKCTFHVMLSEFGIGVGDPGIKSGRIAAKMKIDTDLALGPNPPKTP